VSGGPIRKLTDEILGRRQIGELNERQDGSKAPMRNEARQGHAGPHYRGQAHWRQLCPGPQLRLSIQIGNSGFSAPEAEAWR